MLDAGRRKRLFWIAGPPGSGKTTLVSSYLRERRLPALWYQVDEGDADLASFFYYLGLAGRHAAPRFRSQLPLLTPEYLPGLHSFMRGFFGNLLARLATPSVLVFDNCQLVDDDAPLHAAVLEAASQLPKGLNIVLISRNEPPAAYARPRAHEEMALVGWEQLRLTPAETAGIVRLRGNRWQDKASVGHLHQRAGGWAAGLMLLVQRLKSEGIAPRDLGRRPPEEMVDYFGSEVLGSIEESLQHFLLRCASLPHVTGEAAVAVTGVEGAGRILALLHRHNYFTHKHPGDEPVYEFHALFREFLLARAGETFPAEEMRRVRGAAAAQMERAGRFEDAVTLYREAGDAAGLARVVMTQAPQLLSQGRNQVILEWIGHLPPEAVEAAPWLQCWRAYALLPLNAEESLAGCERAFQAFRGAGDAAGAFVAWSGAVESILFGMKGHSTQIGSWIPTMDRLLEEYGGFPTVEIENRVISSMAKALFASRSVAADVPAWIARAARIVRDPGVAPPLKVDALFSLGLLHLMRGDLPAVESALAALKALLGGQEVPPLLRLTAIWIETAVTIVRARFERCLELVAEALALAEASGVRVLDGMLLGNAAHARLLQGDMPGARELLGRMEPLLALSGPWLADFFNFLRACEALCRGDVVAAQRHAERAVAARNEETGESEARVFKVLLLALLAHDRGEWDACARQMARAGELAARSGSRLLVAQHTLLETYLSLERGTAAADVEALVARLRVAREAGVYTAYIRRPGLLERLAGAALEAGAEVDYARELIRRNHLRPGPEQADLEQWPWPVKVQTFGRFELLREEQPVEFPRKVQQKPLLLLKTLIALGGRNVPEERLTDALWPEADGDLGHQAFSAALHRLRQLLGTDEALQLKAGRLTLSGSVCWVDAWAFERLVAQAEGTPAGGKGSSRRTELLGKALALYPGPFLPDEAGTAPLSAARERLRGVFVRAAEEYGRILEASGRWEEAILCYRRAAGADAASEHIARRLAACCLRTGRETEAAAARQPRITTGG